MINPTKTRNFSKLMIVLAVFLITAGMLSCNNSAPAEEKKAETPAADTSTKMSVDTSAKTGVDTGMSPKDSVEHKGTVTPPPPPPPKN
jgi:hypothetical protein